MTSRSLLVIWTVVAFGILVILPSLSRQANAEYAQESWVALYNGPGNGYDYPRAVTVDHAGNVYVTGGSPGDSTNRDYATIKYDSTGKRVWLKQIEVGRVTPQVDDGRVAVDALGHVHVAGGGSYADGYDFVTVKYIQVPGQPAWDAASTVAMKEESFSNVLNYLFVLIVPIGAMLLWKWTWGSGRNNQL